MKRKSQLYSPACQTHENKGESQPSGSGRKLREPQPKASLLEVHLHFVNLDLNLTLFLLAGYSDL